MDDRNGECFEHHENMYGDGPINTSDPEHECLKDFLLETRDAIRSMPCSTYSDRGDCMETQMTTPNDLGRGDLFENCTDSVNLSSERAQECEIPSNCREIIASQNSCSSIAETTNSDDDRNGSYLSSSLNNEDLTNLSESLKDDKLRDSESSQFKEETETENSSDLSSVVQKDIDNDKASTKCADNKLNVSKKFPVVSHQPNVQESPKSESESQDGEVENAHCSECPSTPKGRNAASRGRKRKGAEVTTARGRPPGPAKKKKQPVTYQSQISPDQNGIKIRIKKSSASATVVRPPRRRERGKKRKGKKDSNTEDEESDIDSNKRVKWKDSSVSEESDADKFGEQSDWGLRLPRQALYDIFFMVTQEEGCLPFLIRLYFCYTSIYTICHNP
jgi:hypothetical protein